MRARPAMLPSGVQVSLVSPIVGGCLTGRGGYGAGPGGRTLKALNPFALGYCNASRTRPRGGTVEDYQFWARGRRIPTLRAPGRGALAGGLGTVTVYFMTDDQTANGIPVAAVVTTVDGYIAALRPVTADVTVAAPAAVALDISINNALPMLQAVEDAIEAELADLIRRETEPGGTLLLSHIREAISTSAGEIDHELTSPVGGCDRSGGADNDARHRHFHDILIWLKPSHDQHTGTSSTLLLPSGPAWSPESGTVLDLLLDAIAAQMADVDSTAANLLDEIRPSTTFDLLPDWERVVGLPDSCSVLGSTITVRRASLLEKLVTKPTLNASEFVRIGRTFGVDIVVDDLDQTRAEALSAKLL